MGSTVFLWIMDVNPRTPRLFLSPWSHWGGSVNRTPTPFPFLYYHFIDTHHVILTVPTDPSLRLFPLCIDTSCDHPHWTYPMNHPLTIPTDRFSNPSYSLYHMNLTTGPFLCASLLALSYDLSHWPFPVTLLTGLPQWCSPLDLPTDAPKWPCTGMGMLRLFKPLQKSKNYFLLLNLTMVLLNVIQLNMLSLIT